MKTLRHFDIVQCKLHSVAGFFFCISLIILLASLSFPQSVRDEIKKIGGSPQFNKSFEPSLYDTNYNQPSNLMQVLGVNTKTKVAKDSGGVSFVDYIKIGGRLPTTSIVVNGTFNTNATGWTAVDDAYRTWSSLYGGSMRVNVNSTGDYVFQQVAVTKGTYNLMATVYMTTTTGINSLAFTAPGVNLSYTIDAEIDTIQINTIVNVTGNGNFRTEYSRVAGSSTSYLDNIIFRPAIDSVRGKSYTVNITTDNDTTLYWWTYYGYWKQKDKDTIWVYADTDTFITEIYWDCQPEQINFSNITDAELNNVYVSDSIIIRDINCDSVLAFSSGDYRIGSLGNWNPSDTFYVSLNDTIWTRLLSALDYFITDSLTFIIYSPTIITDTWTLTTRDPFIPTRVIVSDDSGIPEHSANTKEAFIRGYEILGEDWTDSLWISQNSLATSLEYASLYGGEIVIRSTTGFAFYISLIESYTPSVMTFMPAGSNSHIQVYTSGGNLPDAISTGAGDVANETGYDIEFFSKDPITGEPDLSSYSNGYIAGIMMYLADTLGITLWQVRDTLRARLCDSWTSENGYGLIDSLLVAQIVAGVGYDCGEPPLNTNYMKTAEGDTMFTSEGDTMKISYNFDFNKPNGENNEEDIILPQRVYAVLNERRSTMDIETS